MKKSIVKSKKEVRGLERLEGDSSYRLILFIARMMDRWFLDPIIGVLFPGWGDVISTVMSLPFFYVSLFKIKSVPLTLAMLFNVLMDLLVGLVPGIGDLLDFFNRSYSKNSRLIVGFVDKDQKVIQQVNRRAVAMGVAIVILIILIYGLASLVYSLVSGGWNLLAECFS